MTKTYTDAFGMRSDLIEEKIAPGVVVHSERRTGKTTALADFIYKHHNGNALVMCHDKQAAEHFYDAYRKRFPERERPIVLSPSMVVECRGNDLPLYIDEFWLLSSKIQQQVKDYGIAGAVGTVPALAVLPI